MVQPVTSALLNPDDDQPTCSASLPWCNGECGEWNGEHHTTGFDFLTIQRGLRGDMELTVSTAASEDDGKLGPAAVYLLADHPADEMLLTPARARQLAAMLLNAADNADPLPHGVLVVPAGQVRIGDEIDTPDGWQTAIGLMFFPEANQASVFTAERDDIESDGWQLATYEPVKVRRRIHGSTAIAFMESVQ